jgi:outer membrane protein assembly factor BamB
MKRPGGGRCGRWSASLQAAALVVLLGGCASSNEALRKPAELTEFKPAFGVRTAWRVDIGSSRGAALQPAVAENAVYAASGSGTLARIDPASGQVVWRVDTGPALSAGVGSDGLYVAVGTPRGEVLTYGVDGKLLWKAQVSSDITAPPLVGRGLVLVRSTDQRVTAFEADSGKRRWSYERPQPPLTLRATTEMAFAGDNVVAGFPGGRLVAIAIANGAVRWEATVSEPKGTTEVERLADVIGAVAVAESVVCAASFQGRLMCAETVNGNLRWSRDLSAGAGVALDKANAYAVDARSHVQSYAREGGATLWRNEKLENRKLTTPAALNKSVALGDLAGFVHFLALTDGEFAARVKVDGSAIVARPQRWADGVVVQTQDGTVALLTPGG